MNEKGTKWSWEILLSTAQTDLPTVDCSMFLKITILYKAWLPLTVSGGLISI